jgi:hypothetical protein
LPLLLVAVDVTIRLLSDPEPFQRLISSVLPAPGA